MGQASFKSAPDHAIVIIGLKTPVGRRSLCAALSPKALRSEAESGKAFGITHALIPGNWEGRPGSLEGGAPNYPRNIGDAARSLKDAGVTPGITVDPLLCGGGSDTWIAKSVDGCSWVNPADASGREYTRKRIRKLVEQGFGFVVIEESQIPDEVLLTFNLSRAQAASLAFDIAREAAGSNPVSVLPETSAQLNCVRDEWLAAASAVSRTVMALSLSNGRISGKAAV